MVDVVYKPQNIGGPTQISEKSLTTWERLLFLYGNRIEKSASAVDDDEVATLYTVPAGKIFCLVTATLSIANNDTVRRTSFFYIQTSGGESGSTDSLIQCSAVSGGGASLSINPTIPLIVRSGERITIFNEDTDSTTTGSITGYEIEESLFRTLI